jgi:glycosyltransferase involved in cell wall biosynthesis
MKIGFAGRWNPLNKTAWSGIYFHTYTAIKKYYPVESFYYKWPWHVRESLLLHKQFQKMANKKAAVEFLKGYGKHFSKQLEKDLLKRKVDLLFVPSAPQLIAYCNTSIPIVYMTDATFLQLQGYYPLFSEIANYNIQQGIEMDRLVFQKAAHCMVASDWTKASAIKDYHIDANKISVVPFGANMETVPAFDSLQLAPNEVCQLFFLGVEWERKGGQIALDTLRTLHQNGVPAHLTIIGCTPPGYAEGNFSNKEVTIIPFIDKHHQSEVNRLNEIFRNSDFLLLPTRAECAGIVFCEASAYGIPAITTNTGGVSNYIMDGINGYALPLEADATEYAAVIQKTFSDKEGYRQLCINSRKRYEELLNWESWGKSFHQIAQKILHQ